MITLKVVIYRLIKFERDYVDAGNRMNSL